MADLKSPKENIAEKQVIAIQEAQANIKEIIVYNLSNGKSANETALEIKEIINRAASEFDGTVRQEIKRALAISAQKWEYIYRRNKQAQQENMIMLIDRLGSYNPNIEKVKKTYNLDLGQYIGLPIKQQSQIIEKFRNVLTEDQAGLAIIDDYDKRVKDEIARLAANPADLNRIDKNGKPYKVNLRNFAEMTVRYEENKKDLEKFADKDQDGKPAVKLVWTSSHPDASGRCAPYQGRLWSLDGSKGQMNGIPYEPIEAALAGPRGDGNGIISGYNCRHRLIPYVSGSKAPTDYDKATIRRENQVNIQQRKYERDIRNLKLEEKLQRSAGNTAEASRLRKQWQKKTDVYEQFSNNNGRAFYRWRTRITSNELDIETLRAGGGIPAATGGIPIATIPMNESSVNLFKQDPTTVLSKITTAGNSRETIFKLVKEYKWDGKPYLAKPEEFEKHKVKSGMAIYRGYSAKTQEDIGKFRNDMESGEFYIQNSGGAVYGQGMYSSYNDSKTDGILMYRGYKHSEEFAYKAAKYYSRSDKDGVLSKIDTMTVTADFKAAGSEQTLVEEFTLEYMRIRKADILKQKAGYYTEEDYQIAEEYQKLKYQFESYKDNLVFTGEIVQTPDEIDNLWSNMNQQTKDLIYDLSKETDRIDNSVKALSLGYDGIKIPEEQYLIILNRTKVVLLDDKGEVNKE